METNFNLGSLKIVQVPLADYFNKATENVEFNLKLIRDEKKIPTNFDAIDFIDKIQKTLDMIGLKGLPKVLTITKDGLTVVKDIKFDSKKNVEILKVALQILKNASVYINRLVNSGVDEPTRFYKDYKVISNLLGFNVEIKDLFSPKLDLIETVNEQIQNDLRAGIFINENSKKNLVLHLEKSHNVIQSKLTHVFSAIDALGVFNSDSEQTAYQNVCKQLYDSFDYVQKLKVNKGFFVLFGIYKLYLCVLSPVFNENLSSYLNDRSSNAKSNLAKFERTIARLIQAVKDLEFGEKTGAIQTDQESVKEILFELIYALNNNKKLKEMPVYKDLESFFDIQYCIQQLSEIEIKGEDLLSDEKIKEIEKYFFDVKEQFHILNEKQLNSDDFINQLTKLGSVSKKFVEKVSSNKEITRLASQMNFVFNSVKSKAVTFNDVLQREISLALVLIDYGISGFIKNVVEDRLRKDYGVQTELQISRLQAFCDNDMLKFNSLDLPKLDNISQKTDEKKTFAKIFEQLNDDLVKIEETLDYFLKNDGENKDEVTTIYKPLISMKGIFSVIGKPDLGNVITKIAEPWKQIINDGVDSVSAERLQESVVLVSGLSLLVKAFVDENTAAAEDLYNNLMKVFYQKNKEFIDSESTVPDLHEDAIKETEHEVVLQSNDLLFENEKIEEKIEETIEEKVEENIPSLSFVDNIKDSNEVIFENDKSIVSKDTNVVGEMVYTESTNDPDIAEVFLMEADEVFENLNISLSNLELNMKDKEELTNIRRYFHTLKGSGRMVGLEFMGEAAWMVEQTLNQCLAGKIDFDSNLFEHVKNMKTKFETWVSSLKDTNTVTVDLVSVKINFLEINPSLTNHVEILLPSEIVAEEPSFTFDMEPPVLENEVEIVAEEPSLVFELEDDINEEENEEDEKYIMIEGTKISKVLYSLFSEESLVHIEKLKEYAHSEYNEPVVLTSEFMRHAHTLASIASSVNLNRIAKISSKIESIAVTTIERNLALSQVQMNSIRHVVDNIDLFKELDSSEHVSYYDSLIESLEQLYSNLYKDEFESHGLVVSSELEIIGELPFVKEEDSKGNVIVNMDKLQEDVIKVVNSLIFENKKILDEELMEEKINSDKVVQNLKVKVEELEEQIVRLMEDQEEKAKLYNKALEVTKNDIRIMANMLKKKYEITDQNVLSEIDGEEIKRFIEKYTSEALVENISLSNDDMLETLSNEDSLIQELLNANNFIYNIFEDKVATVEDEVDLDIYEISKPEADEMLDKINPLVESISKNGLSNSDEKELKRYLHTLKGCVRMAGSNKVGMVAHRLESLLDYAETRGLNFFSFKPLLEKELNKIMFLMKDPNQLLDAKKSAWLDEIVPSNKVLQRYNIVSDVILKDNIQESIISPIVSSSKKEVKQYIRILSDVVDSAITDAGEIRLQRTSLEDTTVNSRKSIAELKSSSAKLLKMVKEVEVQAEGQIQARHDQLYELGSNFDPLEFDRFTRLQELTRLMNEAVADIEETISSLDSSSKIQDNTINQQSISTNNLLSQLMKVRLVPVDTVTERFYKIARNTAKELNKKVSLEFFGEKTEIDKLILDKIISPIEHILRNSIAHGIEKPEDRLILGKSIVGKITISISLDGNFTIIKIKDDGSGINFNKVREIGLRRGIIKSGLEYSKDDIINLILQSGFSTAESVSQVSGRGIGMDVVKSEVDALGGRVKIETEKDLGSTFILTIPMDLATSQSMLCVVGEKLIAIPAIIIEEVASLKEEALKNAYKNGVVSIANKEYPIFYMGHLLGILETNKNPKMKFYNSIMRVKYLDKSIVIHVDKLITTTEVLIKSPGRIYSKINGVLGITVLGDGRQGLVINPIQLLEHFNKNLQTINIKIDNTADFNVTKPVVLVVDDSITVRHASAKILERNNFTVVLAKDGEDALEQLQEMTPDIILSDIEMPRMDGFEFVKNVRGIEKFKEIPIIMITSRTADKHQKHAFELGANDFLGKPYKEEELIEKIKVFLEKNKDLV